MTDRVRAPDFDAGLNWLNTDRPLRLGDELRGQVVVLDFWTYCCINCMHILPDLAYLEEKYAGDPVVFIGVHSAKFTNEASRETIRAAVQRYEIKHPVVIDDGMKIWRSYAARSWPTLVVIDPAGYVIGTVAGEGHREMIDQTIAEALEQGRSNGTLADGPLELRREASVRAVSGLAFPGKVLADDDTNRLYVADANHNRIVIAELPDENGHARVIRVIGSGAVGRNNGPPESASFHHPQGLACGQGNLYVADTENNLIRAIDLSSFEVTTIVGTGEMDDDRAGGGMGVQQGINWPWDICLEGATMYVAMAGVHQIWRIDLPVGFARAFAGSGRENIVDGPMESAALAQPSGICAMGGKLYFADSEVSAIRGIDLAAEKVFTVIGEGLFSFGDVDGTPPQAKLQHPLGVAAWKQSLVVADTYNHKIKLVEPGSRSVRTLFGHGRPGASTDDGQPAFFDPGGLSVLGDDVYVADTNNHRVVRINLVSGDWCEIAFDGLTALKTGGDKQAAASEADDGAIIQADGVAIAPDRDVELMLDIELPSGAHLNSEAPWSVRVTADGKTLVQQTGKSQASPLRVTIPARAIVTDTTWRVTASFAYCTDDNQGLCVPVESQHQVKVSARGEQTIIRLSALPLE